MYGRTAGAEQLLATIVGGTTLTWVDDGSLTPTSALPTRDTTNPGTATLAAGTDGQLKAFIANGILSGDMVITVSNVGWNDTGTGTITFAATGQACTLQYINNKWFCIGNNGAAFA